MKCPHCRQGIHEQYQQTTPVKIDKCLWSMLSMTCPECRGTIIRVEKIDYSANANPQPLRYPAFPKDEPSRPVPTEVPDPFKRDFLEACAVLTLSPKASAALSRRTLHAVLKSKAGTTKKDLFDQIQEVIDSGNVPSHISDDLHAVRVIGNFAAHEIKSKITGEIVEVEPGEADWNLDVLESLFDFYFVEPAKSSKRKTAINVKLKDAGKPELS